MAEQGSNLEIGENERVGSYLRRIRESYGLDLKQLSKAICLQESKLQAIEDNQWGSFKTEAYLRSYIGSMCSKLCLDKDVVLKKFSSETNSHFGIEQALSSSEEPAPSGFPKIFIAVIALAVAIIVFFVAKTISSYSAEPISVILQKSKSITSTESKTKNLPNNEPTKEDTIQIAAVLDSTTFEPPQKDDAAKDTIRFECTPSPTENICGIRLNGLDTKMRYFSKPEFRYITHGDTAQIFISVPERTKLFLNNAELKYGRFTILYFHKGEIVNKINRELRK
jgi:transcriptional regulator with XRE-family HTH domain